MFNLIKSCKSLLVATVIVVFFLLSSTSGGFSAGNADPAGGYYQRLADGFLDGHLYSQSVIPEGLSELENPSDPIQSAPYRTYGYHDSIYFENHIYYYWGPGAVLLVVVPMRFVGVHLTETDIGRMALLSMPITTCFFLYSLIKRKILHPSRAVTSLLILGLPFSATLLVTRIAIWESGVLFMSATAYVVLCGLALQTIDGTYRSSKIIRLGLAFFLLAAVLTRPEAALIIALPLMDLWGLRQDRERFVSALKCNLPLYIAGVSGIALLFIYNFLRFGNLLDFGIDHLMGGIDHSILKFSSFSYILPNLFYYILRPFTINAHYPFINFDSFTWPYGVSGTYLTSEVVAGLIFTTPACFLLLPRIKQRSRGVLDRLSIRFLFVAGALLVFLSYAIFGATQRYRLLFDLLVLLAAVLVWSQVKISVKARLFEILIVTMTILVSLLGLLHAYIPGWVPNNAIVKTLKGLSAAVDKTEQRPIFNSESIRTTCAAVSESDGKNLKIMGNQSSDLLQVYVFLSDAGWAHTAPLLVQGLPGSADVIGLQWDGQRARILHDHWRTEPSWSPLIQLESNRYHEFSIIYNGAGSQLAFFIDGIQVLQSDSLMKPLGPTAFGTNRVGAGTVTNQLPSSWFSLPFTDGSQCGEASPKSPVSCPSILSQKGIPSAEYLLIHLRIDLMKAPTTLEQFAPLLSSGIPGNGDALGIKVDSDTIWIIHDHWGIAPSVSRTKFLRQANGTIDLDILATKNSVQVSISNDIVLKSDIGFANPNTDVAFGLNKIKSSLVSNEVADFIVSRNITQCVK
jgi:hypothetical protein